MIQAKFICLSYVIYDIHSDESKDTKIMCILSDYGMKKGNMILQGFMTINWMSKNVIVDFYIPFNAAVTDKYVLTYVSNISRINIES